MREMCFGADIGGTTVKLGLVSREGELLEKRGSPPGGSWTTLLTTSPDTSVKL